MTKKLKAYHPDIEYLSYNNITLDHTETLLDGSFQRYGGVDNGSGWTIEQSEKYIGASLDNKVCNFIVRVHVAECLEFAKKKGCKKSIDYFSKVRTKGWSFVSVDGYNTSSTVYNYLKGKFPSRNPKNTSQTTYFNENDRQTKEDIKYGEKIEVLTLYRILYEDMVCLFKHLNTSTGLNSQEERQAVPSPLSSFIREVSNLKGYNDNRSKRGNAFFRKLGFNASDIDKREHEEVVARLCLKVENNYTGSLTKNQLDAFYRDTFKMKPTTEARVKKILGESVKVAKAIAKGSKFTYALRLSKGKMLSFFDFVDILQDQGLYIKDYYRIGELFFEWDAEFQALEAKVAKEDESEQSYGYWISYAQQPTGYENIRYLYALKIEAELENLVKDTVVGRRRSAPNFNKKIQPALWVYQDAKTRVGAKISIIDVYLGKYDTDHAQSVEDDGKTVFSNAELMEPEINRFEKGSKSNEPFFPHQKQETLDLEDGLD